MKKIVLRSDVERLRDGIKELCDRTEEALVYNISTQDPYSESFAIFNGRKKFFVTVREEE